MASKNLQTSEKNVSPLSNYRSEMNDFFDRFVKEIFPDRDQSNFMPKIEVQDNENNYLVSAELPGIKEEDLDISFENETLILQGEKKNETKREGKGYYRSEMSYGSFYRAIPLARDVNPDKISATFTNGILKVKIDKNLSPTSKGKKIEINKNESTKH